jgi:hypothetical protein
LNCGRGRPALPLAAELQTPPSVHRGEESSIMKPTTATAEYFRDRAQREIAIAEATGAKAHASVDNRMVFVERRDGTRERVRITAAQVDETSH